MTGYVKTIFEASPKIQIKIGSKYDITYAVVHTTASATYDSFGAFTLISGIAVADRTGEGRVVMIPVEHFEYHILRYASGLHASEAGDMDLLSVYEQLVFDRVIIARQSPIK